MSLDTLNQSTPQTPLPDDLQSRIENARNNITIMEAEYARLLKLSSDLDAKIKIQHAESKELEAQAEALTAKKEALVTDVTNLEVRASLVNDQVKIANVELLGVKSETEQLKLTNNASLTALNEREAEVKKHEEDINRREIELIAKENAHLQKVEKLKQALQ